jgi:predicted nucleic acid-binding protein
VSVVLDASAAMEVALQRRHAAWLETILEQEDDAVLAPDLLVPEVVNTVWKYHQFEGLDLAACDRLLQFAVSLVDALVPTIELYREAFLLARSTRRPAYDMFYLALARREDAILLTTDSRLRKDAGRQGVRLA